MRVLVTGAARGIGRALCLRLARDCPGARIAACDFRLQAELDDLAGELRGLGAEVVTAIGDVGDPDVPARLVAQATGAFGGLDALVSNAGISLPGRLVDLSLDHYERVFAVDTRATWLLAKAAHPALKESKGSLIATASMSGMQPHTGMGSYGPAKAALIMLCAVLAQEWARDGIRVNTVSPGFVHTGMTADLYADPQIRASREALVPMGRVATADDIADVMAFLLGKDARYITAQNILVDGGLVSSFLDKFPGRTHSA